jgi:Transcriptional regulator
MGKVDKNKQQKRTSLLETAFSLFTSRGIHNTSISDIVERAGVAKGTFYLYFKDKYDIRNKLIAHKASEVFRKADEALQKEDFSVFAESTVYEEKVVFLADNIINQFVADKTLLRFISKKLDWGMFKNVLTGTGSDGVDCYDIYDAVFQGNHDQYENPEIMVYMIIELVSATCYSAILVGEPASIEDLKPYIFRTVRQIMQSHLIKNEQDKERSNAE